MIKTFSYDITGRSVLSEGEMEGQSIWESWPVH